MCTWDVLHQRYINYVTDLTKTYVTHPLLHSYPAVMWWKSDGTISYVNTKMLYKQGMVWMNYLCFCKRGSDSCCPLTSWNKRKKLLLIRNGMEKLVGSHSKRLKCKLNTSFQGKKAPSVSGFYDLKMSPKSQASFSLKM